MTNREWEKSNKAKGLCVRCTKPLAPNSIQFCEYHLERTNIMHKEHRQRRKDANKCVRCGKPLMHGETTTGCVFCNEGPRRFKW